LLFDNKLYLSKKEVKAMKLLKPVGPFLFAVVLFLVAEPVMAITPPLWTLDKDHWLPRKGLSLSTEGIWSQAKVPTFGFGSVFTGVEEVRLGTTEDRLNGAGFALDLEWWSDAALYGAMDTLESFADASIKMHGSVAPSIEGSLDSLYYEDSMRFLDDLEYGPRHGLAVRWTSSFLDGTSSASEPAGGRNTALTYITDINGVGSAFLGNSGISWSDNTDYDTHNIEVSYLLEVPITKNSRLTVSPHIVYGMSELTTKFSVTSPSFNANDFSSDIKYELDEDRYGFGITFGFAHRFGNRLYLAGGFGTTLVRGNADLDITHNTRWIFGTPQEIDSMLEISDKETYWSVDTNFYAEINYAITNNVSVGVNVNYMDLNKTAKINSRDNFTQMSPQLSTDDTKQLDVGFGGMYKLSDVRLKKDIITIENALDKVEKLRGVQFEWKDITNHPEGKQIGFIAQEAKEIIPEVVSKKGKNLSMQYAPITALLVEAVKELKTENETFKRENEQLREKLTALADRLEAIDEMLLP
jgi:opacity protein-like surface antigen